MEDKISSKKPSYKYMNTSNESHGTSAATIESATEYNNISEIKVVNVEDEEYMDYGNREAIESLKKLKKTRTD